MSHRIFPWQTGDSPRAFYSARLHIMCAVEYFLGQALQRSSVFDCVELSAELGRQRGFFPGFLGFRANGPWLTREERWPRRRSANYSAALARARGGSRRAAPAWHVTRPLPGPAISRARHGVSGGTKATLWRPSPSHNRALCGPLPLRLPRWAEGVHQPRPPAWTQLPAASRPTVPLAGSGTALRRQNWGKGAASPRRRVERTRGVSPLPTLPPSRPRPGAKSPALRLGAASKEL